MDKDMLPNTLSWTQWVLLKEEISQHLEQAQLKLGRIAWAGSHTGSVKACQDVHRTEQMMEYVESIEERRCLRH